jgi:protein Mpv17
MMHPIVKAGLTSGGIMFVADIFAQGLQHLTSNTKGESGFDPVRTVRFAAVGMTCHGPYFMAGFGWVDRLFGSPLSASGTVMWGVLAKKVLTTQLILNPPYMAILFAWMGLLEGRRTVASIVANVVAKWPAAFWMGNLFWPVANTINFRFLGPEYRVACALETRARPPGCAAPYTPSAPIPVHTHELNQSFSAACVDRCCRVRGDVEHLYLLDEQAQGPAACEKVIFPAECTRLS